MWLSLPQLRQYTKIRKVYRFLHQHPLHGKLGRAARTPSNDIRLDGLSSPRTDRPFYCFSVSLDVGNVTGSRRIGRSKS